jgi:RNA polymerase sigma factor (sigma-70 family)
MTGITVLNDNQRQLAVNHIDIVKWVIYEHINVNENIFGLSYDDLYQEGCLCLCRAAVTHNGERAQFVTYAQVVVKNGLLTYCKKMVKKPRNFISIEDLPLDAGGDISDKTNYADDGVYDAILSDAVVFGLLESVKPEYNGIVRLGIEALEMKIKGYTGADIARLWGVEQNHVGAWISRAKDKLRKNERFMAELKAV